MTELAKNLKDVNFLNIINNDKEAQLFLKDYELKKDNFYYKDSAEKFSKLNIEDKKQIIKEIMDKQINEITTGSKKLICIFRENFIKFVYENQDLFNFYDPSTLVFNFTNHSEKNKKLQNIDLIKNEELFYLKELKKEISEFLCKSAYYLGSSTLILLEFVRLFSIENIWNKNYLLKNYIGFHFEKKFKNYLLEKIFNHNVFDLENHSNLEILNNKFMKNIFSAKEKIKNTIRDNMEKIKIYIFTKINDSEEENHFEKIYVQERKINMLLEGVNKEIFKKFCLKLEENKNLILEKENYFLEKQKSILTKKIDKIFEKIKTIAQKSLKERINKYNNIKLIFKILSNIFFIENNFLRKKLKKIVLFNNIKISIKKNSKNFQKENHKIALKENSLEFTREKLSNFPREHNSVQKEKSETFRLENLKEFQEPE